MRRLWIRLAPLVLLAAAAAGQHREASEGGSHEGGAVHKDWTAWKIANFVLLAGGLGYLIGKSGGPFFRNRGQEIRRGIAEATRMKEEAEARAAEVERRMAGLEAEIEALRANAGAEMRAEAERVHQETAAQIARVQSHAEQEIASAAKAARQQLKAYSAELAVELAERKIRARLTPPIDESLVDAFRQNLKPLEAGADRAEA